MEFLRWESIRHLGHDEFINEAEDKVVVMEKLDGMNVSFTNEYVAGRNGPIPERHHGYRGWAKEGLRLQTTKAAERYILFGEWLVSHTAKYKPEHLEKFYLFAAVEKTTYKEVSFEKVQEIATQIGVQTPEVLFKGSFSELELILESLVGKSNISLKKDVGEGIVILNKTKGFRTKIVTEYFVERAKLSFKPEKEAALAESESWIEEYGTPARIAKTLHKLLDEEILLEEDLVFKKFTQIEKLVTEYTYKDILEESESIPENLVYEKAYSELKKKVVFKIKEFLK